MSVTTAILPSGWRERLIVLDTPATEPGRGLCLERHDCVISKLVADRWKDLDFAGALPRERLVNADAEEIGGRDDPPLRGPYSGRGDRMTTAVSRDRRAA